MSSRLWIFLAMLALACVFALGSQTSASAQGRGGGGMVGGTPAAGGYGMGRGVDMNRGRLDDGLSRATDRSGQRPDVAREIARIQRENVRHAERDLRDHPEVVALLHTSAEDLREGYRAALMRHPTLNFERYVLATRLALSLGVSHPKVTREELLIGLAEGKSIRRTLRNLGLSSEEAKEAELRAEREIKESRRRS